MASRLGRVFAAFAVLLALALLVATALVVTSVRESFPASEGEVRLPGLAAPVEIRRGDYGIPQIYASTPEDLFRAQGYVHAQDRFFQMDFRRHLTSGRLAEWFGPDLLAMDKFARTMGWRRTASRELHELEPKTRRYLEAYADGVNAYLGEHQGSDLSVEYTMGVLGPDERIDPWSPVDSLAWLKAIAWDLRSNLEDEITRSLISAEMPVERVRELYPGYPYDRHEPIVRKPQKRKASRAAPALPTSAAPGSSALSDEARAALAGVRRALRSAPAPGDRTGVGSNSWVVAGAKTRSGKPILANDPHLRPSMPSIWYQTGLHCKAVDKECPFDVAGFSFTGLPGIVIGHNHKIAWGFTNLGADVTDLFLERVSGSTYMYNGKQRPLAIRRETIRVKGEPDVTIDVRSTKHGPLLSDIDPRAAKAGAAAPAGKSVSEGGFEVGVALRWTALDVGTTADAIFALDTATDWRSFRQAASEFQVPSQNMVYADVEGHIGYQAPGRIPIRKAGTGKWPVPGWTGTYDWKGWVPFEKLPSVLDPKAGFIVTANNAVAGRAYPHRLVDSPAYGYRSQRIRERLQDDRAVDVRDMAQLQLDTRNDFARTLVPALLRLRVDSFTTSGQDLLRGWDGSQSADSAPAAYFNAVWKQLLDRTFGDELKGSVRPEGGDRWYEVVRRLLDDPDSRWWDDVRTKERERRDDILRAAMVQARLDLTRKLAKDPQKWEWGRLHRLELRNQVFGSSGSEPLEALFNRGPYQLGGGEDTVLSTGWDTSADDSDTYRVTSVPSMRMVVDLGAFDRSRWIDLTGVSGHPWHANYGDQTELWAAGETLAWPFSRRAVQQVASDRLMLIP